MSENASEAIPTNARSLAASLAPLIIEVCDDRLSDIVWFKADWQRGGSATASALYTPIDQKPIPVVIKLPVVLRELTWTRRLQDEDSSESVVPRLYASGESLGGYDLAWIIIEKFQYGPLGMHWNDNHIARIVEAAAKFHAAAAAYPVNQDPRREEWDELIRDAQVNVKLNQIDHQKRWKTALKTLLEHLSGLVECWRARDVNQWLHGDLHLANAMSRVAEDKGPVSLIDLAEIHAGNWIEDAIYLERQLWAVPERLKPHPPVKELARARKNLGLPVEKDYTRLAMIRRALLASTAPRFIKSEGHPKYLEACLNRLENALIELK